MLLLVDGTVIYFTQSPPGFQSCRKISLTYSHSPGAEAVLKNVTLLVQPGKHIAICGRSGSGKTPLVLSLLRMLDVSSGSMKLEGIDITAATTSGISAEEVRSRINVVPQDPFLLPGTSVRFNVDPLSTSTASDEDLTAALQRVGLWELVRAEGGLDKDVDTLPLSAGQKQLLCFARAIVRRRSCNILVLDEATSR